ncbi:hypothetical protein [Pontibacter fetidus]|uniref:Uncharacterized protein n=1 Tax=Pontibacter fetidus TaxID=2700082 RepID=A0A6B2H6D4_9BACT|nr:hypothetical protein [Pontibacter fetidus]NDK57748.1 hypothetical protein [Pontibacter fetidus]
MCTFATRSAGREERKRGRSGAQETCLHFIKLVLRLVSTAKRSKNYFLTRLQKQKQKVYLCTPNAAAGRAGKEAETQGFFSGFLSGLTPEKRG